MRDRSSEQQTLDKSTLWTALSRSSKNKNEEVADNGIFHFDFYVEEAVIEVKSREQKELEFQQAREYLLKHVNNTILDHGSPSENEEAVWPEFIDVLDDLQEVINQRGIRASLADAVQLLTEVSEGDLEVDDCQSGSILIGYQPSLKNDNAEGSEEADPWDLPPLEQPELKPLPLSKADKPTCSTRAYSIRYSQSLDGASEEEQATSCIREKGATRPPVRKTDSGFHTGSLETILEEWDDGYRPHPPPKDDKHLPMQYNTSQSLPNESTNTPHHIQPSPSNFSPHLLPDTAFPNPVAPLGITIPHPPNYTANPIHDDAFTTSPESYTSHWSPETSDSDSDYTPFEWISRFTRHRPKHIRTKSKDEGLLRQLAGSEPAVRLVRLLRRRGTRKRPVLIGRISKVPEKALRVLGASVREVGDGPRGRLGGFGRNRG